MVISSRARRLIPLAAVVGFFVIGLIGLVLIVQLGPALVRSTGSTTADAVDWPRRGQAAYAVGDGPVISHGPEQAVPLASTTKIMTALVVLERAPLVEGQDGFTLVVDAHDVEDTERRRLRSESVLGLEIGDRITERDALLALLLPSANNVAVMLADRLAGSSDAFVAGMNDRARQLGLQQTHYADVSGIDPASRSTAHDQTVLARVAMANPTFAWLVSRRRAVIPAVGTVVNTNRLLGRDGFVGLKTGTTTPAGGCLVFAVRRGDELIVGAVLGQRGDDLSEAAADAASDVVSSVRTAGR